MGHPWVIVGAGLVGCTLAERIATQLDQRVLVLEMRKYVGGTACDYVDAHGVLIHRHGPHLFHTNDERVWRYLSRFTKWRSYEHRVLADVDGVLVPVPFNFNSLDLLLARDRAAKTRELLLEEYGDGREIPILQLRQSPRAEIRKFATFVYEKIFYGYTLKQWGLTPEQLGPSVTGRVPVRLSRDDRYFRDRYQAIPRLGYTSMVKRMLSHRNIEVALGTNFDSVRHHFPHSRIIYTGSIDNYFSYMHGHLPYRSLRFEFVHESVAYYQKVGQINYPNDYSFTRIVEYKHITGQKTAGTTLTREYPQAHESYENEPYYPIPCPANVELYAKYAAEAAQLKKTVLFAGRLADYKYYNMDQAVARALSLFGRNIAPTNRLDGPFDGEVSSTLCKVKSVGSP